MKSLHWKPVQADALLFDPVVLPGYPKFIIARDFIETKLVLLNTETQGRIDLVRIR